MRIGWRLTWWYAVAVLAILVLAGVATFWGAEGSFRAIMLHRLDANALLFERRVGATGVPRGRIPLHAIGSATAPRQLDRLSPLLGQVSTTGGRVVNRSAALGGQTLPPAPAGGMLGLVRLDGTTWAVMERRFATASGAYRLELAAPWGPMAAVLANLERILALVGLGGACAAVAGGLLLARAALSRVDAIRRTADEIGESDLSKRLPLRGTADELDRMAASFNAMLDRVEEAYRRQSDFVADASHELRTPTTAIAGLSRMLLRWGADDPHLLRESLAGIERQAVHLARLVNDLLALARGQADGRTVHEDVDLAELARLAVTDIRPGAGTRRLRLDPLDAARVRGDPLRLRQVLNALLDNAVRFTPDGGTIRVGVRSRPDEAVIEVEDDGPGIAAADLPRIFDRFYRGAHGPGGAGLGLAIARAIAAEHGGAIEAVSESGGGTLLRVTLPSRGALAPSDPPWPVEERG